MATRGLRIGYGDGTGTSEAFFTDSFEGGQRNSTAALDWDTSDLDVTVQSTDSHSGDYSLRFRFGPDADGEDSSAEQRFTLGDSYTDIWVKYWIKFPTNYFHRDQSHRVLDEEKPANNKGYLYLWSGDYGDPSGPGMGPNFWPNNDAEGTSSATFYVWGMGTQINGANDHHFTGMPKAVEAEDYGKWIRIVLHYKYATAANNDGVAEIWKTRDGVTEKIYEQLDGPWYVEGQPGFDQGYILGYANSGFEEQTDISIDELESATSDLWGVSS